MTRLAQNFATIATLGSLLLSASYAQASASLPPIKHDGLVKYLSGGIGQDEAKAIDADSRSWPLTLEFVVMNKPRAEFAADVKVAISDSNGRTVMRTNAEGPFLLAKLTPGSYVVDASYGGKALHKSVVVKSGQPTKSLFEWPAGTGEEH